MLKHPAFAAAVLLSTFAIEQFFQGRDPWFFAHQTVTNYMTVLLGIWALFVRFARGEPTIFPLTREFWLFVALYGYAAVSTLWSVHFGATQMFREYIPYLVSFGLVLPMLIVRASDAKYFVYTMLALGLGLVPLFLFSSEWDSRQLVLNRGANIGSLIGETGNPLAIASFAGWCAILAAMVRLPTYGWPLSVLRWVFVFAAAYLCMKTASRGQTVAIAVSILTFLPFARRINSPGRFIGFAVLLIVLLIGGNFMFEAFAQSDSGRWKYSGFWDDYTEGRLQSAFALIRIWAESGPAAWIFGLGNSSSYSLSPLFFYCHVVMAEALGELGLIGFVMIWLAPIFGFLTYRHLYGLTRGLPDERGIVAGLGACLLFEIILSFKQGALLGSEITFTFLIILGRLLATMKEDLLRYQAMDDRYYQEMAAAEADQDAGGEEAGAEVEEGLAVGARG